MNWWGSLERHAFPIIGDVEVDRIRRSDVLTVLEPIWAVRPETARRVRAANSHGLEMVRGARLLHW